MRLYEIAAHWDKFNQELPGTKGNWAPYIVRRIETNDDDTFKVFQQSHEIASARLNSDKTAISDLSVRPEHQHRGIATALYKHIESVLGYPLKPSRVQTDDGKGFWKSRSA